MEVVLGPIRYTDGLKCTMMFGFGSDGALWLKLWPMCILQPSTEHQMSEMFPLAAGESGEAVQRKLAACSSSSGCLWRGADLALSGLARMATQVSCDKCMITCIASRILQLLSSA